MRIAILGGGPTGLVAAEKLCARHEITVFEKDGQLGGLAGSFDYAGMRVPMFYHQVLAPDAKTAEYFRRFGSAIERTKIKMAIAAKGKVYDFATPTGLLTFDYLSLRGRLEFAVFAAYSSFVCDVASIPEDQSVEEWLDRHTSAEVKRKIFEPLYAVNKFGIPLSRISARQLAVRLRAREAMGDFGYPAKGFDFLFESLAGEIKKHGGTIRLHATIRAIDVRQKTVEADGQTLAFDAILCTLPPRTLVRLAKNLPADYAAELSRIEYCPAVCVAFATDEFISEHYWTNLFGERAHTLFQHSRLFDRYDKKINWILRYGGSGEDLNKSDDEIREAYLGIVRAYYPRARIAWSNVFRAPNAEPVYHKDYAKIMPAYKSPVPGLYLAGIALTYPEIRSTNTAILSGEKAAATIEADFA